MTSPERYRRLEPALFSLLIPAIGWYDYAHPRKDVSLWVYLLPLGFAVAVWFGRDRPRRIGLGVIGCMLAWSASGLLPTIGLWVWVLHGVP
ncbi:hypothetical protein [Streptomyces sp. NBC_00454]|uniref:hypothetical protein n=1 Tax=Streptomyces sp. NBC_00454 TaxID=2975747 RepID=UPI003255E707